MKRILCLLVPFLTCFMPAVQAKEAKRVIPFTRVAPSQGMVMMRLITNRKMSAASPKWDKFDVHELKTGKTYKLDDMYGGGHHATFVASLPPGEYQADRLRVGDPVWQSLAEYGEVAFEPEGAWRFRVEAGRSWRAISNLPKSTQWFLVLPGQEILIATEAGQLYSTPDNGKSWRQERNANSGI